jgi:hypothetical protein
VVEYPDSGKYFASATGLLDGEPKPFGRVHRAADELDYWDGEP